MAQFPYEMIVPQIGSIFPPKCRKCGNFIYDGYDKNRTVYICENCTEDMPDNETDDAATTTDWVSLARGVKTVGEFDAIASITVAGEGTMRTTQPYTAGPGLAVDPTAIVTANKPLYTITLFDGTVIGGKMAYQEQYALVVGEAYYLDGEEGQYPDGCDLRIPYNAIKFWHMQV